MGPLRGPRANCDTRPVPTYRIHDTTGDDLGLIEHPTPNVEPGDVIMLADGREALVTARVETGGGSLAALLEVARCADAAHKRRRDRVTRIACAGR